MQVGRAVGVRAVRVDSCREERRDTCQVTLDDSETQWRVGVVSPRFWDSPRRKEAQDDSDMAVCSCVVKRSPSGRIAGVRLGSGRQSGLQRAEAPLLRPRRAALGDELDSCDTISPWCPPKCFNSQGE